MGKWYWFENRHKPASRFERLNVFNTKAAPQWTLKDPLLRQATRRFPVCQIILFDENISFERKTKLVKLTPG
jgi:hypothetical protein